MGTRRCAESPLNSEYSLCGDAFDSFASGDAEEGFEFAGQRESITCPACCQAIRAIKAMRNPLRPRKVN